MANGIIENIAIDVASEQISKCSKGTDLSTSLVVTVCALWAK